MSFRVNGRKIEIDVSSLVSQMTGDARRDLIDVLACENDVIAGVIDQVCFGETDLGSCGERDLYFPNVPRAALSRAQRQIAENSGEVAKMEIARALYEIGRLKERVGELSRRNDDLALKLDAAVDERDRLRDRLDKRDGLLKEIDESIDSNEFPTLNMLRRGIRRVLLT